MSIKSMRIENWAQLVANIGVIAGIIFLAFELQQNNELLDAEARRDRATFLQDTHRLLATDEKLAALVLKSNQTSDLTELERFQVHEFWLSVLHNIDLARTEMHASELEPVVQRLQTFFQTSEGLKSTWTSESHRFSPDFVAWMEDIRTQQ
ncbi:MAG: hypothetical protein AAF465_17450 [Pseudomonadota bacterium]